MYGYIHRLAYYNGFKSLAAFLSYITGHKHTHILPKELMGSREILQFIVNVTHQTNSKTLKLNWKAFARGPAHGFTFHPKACPTCISHEAILKHEWLFGHDCMCHEHGMPLVHIESEMLNTQKVINWDQLIYFCKDKAGQDLGSALDNIAQLYKTLDTGVSQYVSSYFQQRRKEVASFALLTPALRRKLPSFDSISCKLEFENVLTILSKLGYVSDERAYQLVYWGIVDPLLKIDRLGFSKGCWRSTRDSIEYCKSEFINDFPPSYKSKIFSDIRYPNAFHKLKVFSPALSHPWLNLLDAEEFQPLAS